MQRRVLGFDQRYALDPFGMRHGALIAAGNSWQAQSGYEHVRCRAGRRATHPDRSLDVGIGQMPHLALRPPVGDLVTINRILVTKPTGDRGALIKAAWRGE